MQTEPSGRVQKALAELGTAIEDEDFKLIVLFAWPDLTAMATLTNMEAEAEVLAVLRHAIARVESGEWRRERGEVRDGEPT